MAARVPCEFFLVRYVPDAVKNEFVNIGVVLREAARPEGAVVRFTRDWSRVRCMDPDADTGMLESLEGEIAARLRLGDADFKPVMRVMEDTFSNAVQLSEPRASLAESVAAEMEQLMAMYVESRRERVARKRTGRAALQAEMRGAFEHAGVWELMRKRIAAAEYTRVGDPLKIDCGYRPDFYSQAAGAYSQAAGAVVRMFHAVSLEGDLEAAKVLAFAAPALRDGLQRVEGASLDLAAVVEPVRQVEESFAEEGLERYRYGVETMESAGIRVIAA
ncbi:MAG: DUF3037 domain-containing protein [Acidobacteria bacterium]|nr:DUF3037 domain-containing protein [Acidobacteriota bacterium]